MYEEVRADVEMSRPDRFVSVGSLNRNPIGRSHEPPPSLGRMVSGLSRKTGIDLEKEPDRYGSVASSEAHHVRNRLFDDVSKLKSMMEEKMKEVAHLERTIETHAKTTAMQKEQEAEKFAQARVREVGDLEKSAEGAANDEIQRVETKQLEAVAIAEDNVDTAAQRLKDEISLLRTLGRES